MNDPILIREQLRKVLALNPRVALTEARLKLGIERVMGGQLSVPEFQVALEWNHSRNLVDFIYDSDSETNLWGLTAKGKAKEGVK